MKNSSRSLLLKLFVVSGLLMLLTFSAQAWRVSISDCQGCGSRAEAVVVDAAGDVIAVGGFYYGADAVKFSGATGNVIWRSEVMGHESRNYAQDIAIDSHGDVFVVFAWTRVVVKVSGADGRVIWSKPIGGTLNALLPIINAVKVDRDDNVITAGTMGGYFNVCKLDGRTGDERWHNDTRGGMANAVAVDGNGDVAAAGIMSKNFATVKLRGGNGEELWHKEINGAGSSSDDFEEANAVAMDQDGSVVVAGVTSNEVSNPRDFTVAKYLPDGRTKWIEIVDGNYIVQNDRGERFRISNDLAYAVTIDRDGNAIAVGSIQVNDYIPAIGNTPEHFRVIKIGREGGVIWSKPAEDHIIGQDYIAGHAFAVSVDDAGDVAAGGVHDGRFTVAKFRGPTGEKAWPPQQLNSGGLGNGNNALSVIMDASRSVVAAGEIIGPDGWPKFIVVKLRGADGTDYVGEPPTPTVPETVVKYAPMVYLHSDDHYRPDSPITFINNSSLGWFHEGGCKPHSVADLDLVDPQRLGSLSILPYSHSPIAPTINGSDCNHISQITFRASDFTRPYDSDRKKYDAFWNNAFYQKEGFYLDLDDGDMQDELRRGIQSGPSIFPGTPVFYEYIKGKYVAYWFFYPYDDFSEGPISVQHHEGDWERISIQLDSADAPVNVFYYSHENGQIASWGTIDKYEVTHPVVYSARGSHASYPDEGVQKELHCILGVCAHDSTNRGPRWLTWNSLRNVEAQPWYGFGGAWGEVDAFNTPAGSFEGKNFTGPLGPSTYKRSKDKWDPILLTEENSTRAIALDSVTSVRDPFSLFARNNFGSDQHTRVTLFAENVDLVSGENLSGITAQAEDSQHRTFPLTVEYLGKVPSLDWITQIAVRLPDGLAGDVLVGINLRGVPSNKVLISIKP